jgi:branched-chain amino acid transport system permease protein
MTIETLLQPFVSGILTGMTYVLTALGLTVIFSIMNVLNFAHGEIYMFGAFCVYFLCSMLHIPYPIALMMSIVAVGLFGIILERVFFRPARGDILTSVIVAIALIWVFQTSAQLIFGGQPRGMAELFPGTVTFFNMRISQSRLFAGFISFLLLVGLYLFVYKTKQGKAMQALAQDRDAAALQGVDIDRVGPLGFAIGCALAGAAGGIMAPILFVDATMGSSVLGKSLSIIILGGVGSIPGAALGGLIVGVVESYGQRFVGYPSSTFPFLIMILILLFKRTGLMGRQV